VTEFLQWHLTFVDLHYGTYDVMLMMPEIFRSLLDLREICAPLVNTILFNSDRPMIGNTFERNGILLQVT
jgi:hypothetical protein